MRKDIVRLALVIAFIGVCLYGGAAYAFVTTDVGYPSCDVPAPRPDERVTTIFADRGQGLSTVTLGADSTFTEVADIEVQEADRPHYITLASAGAIIWRFRGRVDTVSRLVVFGAQEAGHEKNGVIGIPRERIVFLAPDREEPDPRDGWTTNWGWSRACEPSIYFDIPFAFGSMRLGSPKSWSKAAPTYPNRFEAHQHIHDRRAATLRIPGTGNIERGEYVYVPAHQRDGAHERGLIVIDPGAVVSQAWASPYAVLPSWAGIEQLVEAGVLIPPSDPHFQPIYDRWNDAISRPYETPLVRDFRLSYTIDHIIAKPTPLPARARGTFLLMPGLEAPELDEHRYACVFFSDLRPFPEEQPRRRGWLARDPRCDERLSGIFDLPGGEARLQHDSDIDTGVRSLARIMKKQSEFGQKCRTADLPETIPLIGVLMENAHANRLPEQAGDITVEVTRPGRVTLYLEPFAPFNWHVKPGPNTEIVGVVYKEGVSGATPAGKRLEGISSTVEIRNIRPAGMDKICNDLQGLRQTANNAPAILTLDHELNSLTGRGLDLILTKEGDAVLQPATESEKARWRFTVR